ncbi:hypothetical protein H0H81_001758 [Sphagnurus paluster]|uniref:Uncharacterized protein n=1 Tax=Sphagnurus paluster TaxID=117069 RepID=A0A9P7GM56_9AGAR|nr:hypothetical protein H0H81_001758 [Sphagnurus paluster]
MSDSDSPRAARAASSTVAKPPGAQIRSVAYKLQVNPYQPFASPDAALLAPRKRQGRTLPAPPALVIRALTK